MRHLEQELLALRQDMTDMWKLVISQVSNAGDALLSFDKELAQKVLRREKKVDAYELKIDSECENIIALHQPVAIDLRFLLAVLKINGNIERIGDFAYGIAHTLISYPSLILDADLITQTNLRAMISHVHKMLTDTLEAFENERSDAASSVFSDDYFVDEINKNAPVIIADYIKANPERALECLHLIAAIRKMERIGDHCSNIAEEIFFYTDAKVLKHSSKISEEDESSL